MTWCWPEQWQQAAQGVPKQPKQLLKRRLSWYSPFLQCCQQLALQELPAWGVLVLLCMLRSASRAKPLLLAFKLSFST